MRLSNAMERAVRTHLHVVRSQAPAGCWCPLCRADLLALTLSRLPPRYATRRALDLGIEAQLAASIHAGLAQARAQVERFPKHAAGLRVAAEEPVWVVNFPLEECFKLVEAIIRRNDGACDCWHCRCDTVAIALNQYPARYGVEYRGETELLDRDRASMREELVALLERAALAVESVPRHDSTPAA